MRSHREKQYSFRISTLNKFKENAQVVARTARPYVLKFASQFMSLQARIECIGGKQVKCFPQVRLGITMLLEVSPHGANEARRAN